MKKIILTLIWLAVALATKAYAYDDHDFQVWNTDAEELNINKDAKIALEEEFRWGNNASELFYQHYDLGFFYNVKEYLNLGGGYRHVLELKSGKFRTSNEPYATLTLLWKLQDFKFDDRSRLEYRHFDYQTDSWRYRNKFTLKLPWKFTKLEIQPYLSDEIFIGFGTNSEFNQNRLSPGLSINLTKNIKAEIYYMLQSVKNPGQWKDANILGTKVKIAF